MKTGLLLFVLALVMCGASCFPKHCQTLTENGFTVSMPGVPKKEAHTSQTAVGPITAYTYTVDFRSGIHSRV